MSETTQSPSDAEQFVAGVVEAGSAARLPRLTTAPPGVVYGVTRNGVTTVVARTGELTEEELVEVLRFRLAQYLVVGYVDADRVWKERMQAEPLSFVEATDIHFLSLDSADGQILCYATFKGFPDADHSVTLRDRDRQMFSVEQTFGWGVFNEFRILPDLPLARVWECKRLVVNHLRPTLDEQMVRAPVELMVAFARVSFEKLRGQMEAIIGDLEIGVIDRTVEFAHVPLVTVPAAVSYAAPDDYLLNQFSRSVCRPFALLVSDVSLAMDTRIPLIEEALDEPGKAGVKRLFELKRDPIPSTSSLLGRDQLHPLSATSEVADLQLPMPERRVLIDQARRLREVSPFDSLTQHEATNLRAMMEQLELPAGEVIIRRGDIGDSLYVIEQGTAVAQATEEDGTARVIARMGPGQVFGEIALVTGTWRTFDVVAGSNVRLLRLSQENYERYLAGHAGVAHRLAVMAARRAVGGDTT
ncbi:MAG: cyclic nucleotide-binding domain-containing protein [Gaiellales bacterium]